jgi:hypothetical protein
MSWTVSHKLFTKRELKYLEALGETGRVAVLKAAVPVPVTATVPTPVVSSVALGVKGESHVREALNRQYGAAKPGSHAGDLLIEHRGVLLMVEVKNYSKPVPTAEVAKFHADATAIGANLAMMVSLHTSIVGVGTFGLESDRRRLIVQCSEPEAIVAYAEMLFGLAETCIADLDAVERLARKSLRSIGRLSAVREALIGAEKALATASSSLVLAEAEANYLLEKLIGRTRALSHGELIEQDVAVSRLVVECLARYPSSWIARESVIQPFAQKIACLAPFVISFTSSNFTIKHAQGSFVIEPQVTQLKITSKSQRRELTIKGKSMSDFDEVIQQVPQCSS